MSVVLATAGYDHRLRFWEAPSGRCSRILRFSDSQVNRLEISPDKQFIAAAGNPVIRVYEVVGDPGNTNTGGGGGGSGDSLQQQQQQQQQHPQQGAVLTLEGHVGNVTAIGFQKEGRYLYSSSEDGTMKVWDLRNPHYSASFRVGAAVNSVTLRTDRDEFISGDQSGCVKIWDLRMGGGPGTNGSGTDNGGGTTSRRRRHRSSNNNNNNNMHQEPGCLNCLCPSAGNLPLSPSNSTSDFLTDFSSSWEQQQQQLHSQASSSYPRPRNNSTSSSRHHQKQHFYSEGIAPIQAVDVSEDSRTLVAISNHGTVFVWDPSTSDIGVGTGTGHSPNRWTPPLFGEHNGSGGPDEEAVPEEKRIKEQDNDKDVPSLDMPTSAAADITSETNSPNRSTSDSRDEPLEDSLVGERGAAEENNRGDEGDGISPSSSSTLGLLRPITKFRAHAPGTYCLHGKIAPDCRHLVTTSSDGTAKLWDTTTWELTSTLVHHTPQNNNHNNPHLPRYGGGAGGGAIRPPHRSTMTAGGNKSQASSVSSTSSSSSSWVWDAAFCADSTYLVTASSDQIARLWNLRSGDVVRQYHGHESAVTCVALNDSNVL